MPRSSRRRTARRRWLEPLEPRRLLDAAPIISELMASNDGTILDGDGASSDWIELFNAGDESADLQGWFLTDNATNLDKWSLPAVTLPAGEFLLVFASGQDVDDYVDPAGYLHTNFKLSAGGEYLALVQPDGVSVVSEFAPQYSQQFTDTSYGVAMSTTEQTLIAADAEAQTLIPPDGGLGLSWTAHDFAPDASWITESSPGVPATLGVGYASDDAHPNLTAHWALDEPAGTSGPGSIVDGALGHQGTPVFSPTGGVTFGHAGATANTDTAAEFTNGKISVPRDPALNPDSFTFAAWVFADTTGGTYRSVVTSRYGATPVQEGYILYNTPAGEWDFWTGFHGAGNGWNQLSGGPVTTGVWTHVAISYDAASDTKSIYVNGALAGNAVTTQYVPNANGGDLHLGGGADDGNSFLFDGKIDDAALWNTALSLTDVQNAMTSGAATVATGQVARWPLDEPAGTGGIGAVDDALGDHDGNVAATFALGAAGATANTATSAVFGNASIDVPYADDLNPQSFTVTAWVRPASTAGYQSVITSRDNAAGNDTFGYVLYNDAAGQWAFWTGNGDPGWPQTIGPAVQVGQWQHLAISYDATTNTKSLYFNGTLAASDTDPVNSLYAANTVDALHIGAGADDGSQFFFDGNIDDVAVFDTALDEATIAQIMADGTPAAGAMIDDLIATDVGTAMHEVNASAYVRIPFTVADPGGIDNLQLRIKYDDGFVAYLNGQRVAAANAPTPLAWDSAATGSRALSEVRDDHQMSLTEHLSHLRSGANVLAVHGLNAAADDAEFLILPQLDAFSIDVLPAEVGYFTTPTPGAPNAAAASDIGPLVDAVVHTPVMPTTVDPLVVAAQIVETAHPVDGVSLVYRVMYGAEQTLAMLDDGVAPDAAAGDGLFTAAVPAGVAQPGEMIRYYVATEDTQGNTLRGPLFADPDAPQYFGTVVADPSVDTQLPVLHWFVPDPTWHQSGTNNNKNWSTASAFFDGQFYDNMLVRVRGQSTVNWAKPKFKFESARGQDFQYSPAEAAVEEFNLQSHFYEGGRPTAYMRETLAFEWFREIGAPGANAFHVHVRQNGSFYSLASFIEQIDATFLDRNGFDDSGALYKSFSPRARGTLAPNPTTVDYRKVNREDEPWDDFQTLTDGLNDLLPGIDRSTYIFDAINLPEVINEMAGHVVMPNHDRLTKNYYMYLDPDTHEWNRLPWDTEASFRVQSGHFASVLYGDSEHPQSPDPIHQNHLLDAILDTPATREMYLRRVRTLMDQYLNAGYFEQRANELHTLIAPDAALDNARWGAGAIQTGVDSIVANLAHRRAELGAEPLIPPSDLPGITYTTLLDEAAPGAAIVPDLAFDQAFGMDWTGLPQNEPWDDSLAAGWLQGASGVGYDNNGDYLPTIGIDVDAAMDGVNASVYTRFAFNVTDPAAFDSLLLQMRYDDGFVAYLNGVEIERANFTGTPAWNSATGSTSAESTVFVDFDVSDHLAALQSGTNVLAVHGLNASPTSSDMLILPRLLGGVTDTGGQTPIDVDFGAIEFNPASGNQDEEYIELVNSGDASVDISGWQLTGGVEFTFQSGTVLPADFTMYVSPDVVAFRGRTTGPSGGQGLFVQGGYAGHISNLGETIELLDADGAIVTSVATPYVPSPAQEYLRVGEVMYNPPPPTQAEIDAGFVDNDDFEFIELVNTSDSVALTLDGITFTRGITFAFTDTDPGVAETTLEPGQRILVVRDAAAFAARYDTAGMTVAGEYRDPLDGGNRLSNDGEVVKLEDADNSTIQQFDYNDNPNEGWPAAADGLGSSLEVVNTASDYDEASTWYASVETGGTPGEAATPAVLRRMVSYAGSAFDVGEPDDAVATDKQALLSGQTATSANYTNFADGINGVIIDVANPAAPSQLGLDDLTFSVGNDNAPDAWTAAPTPTLSVLPDGGVGGSTRLLLTWDAGEVANTWLRVALTDDPAASGLPSGDVFYFGNAIGETGNDPTNALVTAADLIAIRNRPRGDANRADIADPYDINRDRHVDATDVLLARNHATGPFNALRLITPAEPAPSPPEAEPARASIREHVFHIAPRSVGASPRLLRSHLER